MTSCTPARPRCRRLSQEPRQNVSSSLSPTSGPRTSREPSAAIPVATTRAIDTTLPPSPGWLRTCSRLALQPATCSCLIVGVEGTEPGSEVVLFGADHQAVDGQQGQ